MKLRGKRRMAFILNQEFIDRFVEAKKANAKKSRRAASDLEKTLRILGGAPTSNTPPGPPKVTGVQSKHYELTDQDIAQTASIERPKIEPQKLTIVSGFTTVM